MARPHTLDPYHNFRFHVAFASGANVNRLNDGIAGFQSVTLPSVDLESVEYREGLHTYKRKFPGIPSFDTVTLMRGVTDSNSDFYNWIQETISGAPYRYDLIIRHFHRTNVSNAGLSFNNSVSTRGIKLFNCFPKTYKPGSDLDSVGSDVSLQELVLEIERFEVLYGASI